MSSITAQQTKLDLELVPKENRLDIEKCNIRIPHGLTPRELTFQIQTRQEEKIQAYFGSLQRYLLDLPKSTGCINPGELLLLLPTGVHLERLVVLTSFVSPELKSFERNKIGMHTSKDDYLINSLRFVSAKESTQIYGAILLECLTSPAMKENKAYKTYLGYATGVVPPKMDQKFKKASPSKKDSDLVPIDEEPV
ncbi:hypothetical protein Tco_1437218 [Tanacetum coccineum]